MKYITDTIKKELFGNVDSNRNAVYFASGEDNNLSSYYVNRAGKIGKTSGPPHALDFHEDSEQMKEIVRVSGLMEKRHAGMGVHELEIDVNTEGDKLASLSPKDGTSGLRIAGPKAWGGSTNIASFLIDDYTLIEYIRVHAPHIIKELG